MVTKPDSVLDNGKPEKIWLRLPGRKDLWSSTGVDHRAGGAELAWWQNVLEMVPVDRENRGVIRKAC